MNDALKKSDFLSGQSLIFFIAILFLSVLFFPADTCAKPPPWVASRPMSRDFYIGIAACNKQETEEDCRSVAEHKALFDLSSEISVDISGEFVEKVVERTGLSAQDVRMEVRAASHARLSGHEMVAEYEDKQEYWVYFRLSKETYHRMISKEREAAVAAAVDMTLRALEAISAENTVSALRFYFEALAKVQDFLGENIRVSIQNRSTFLLNEIYTGLQNIMADIRLEAKRKRLPAIAGAPLHEPFSVAATLEKKDGRPIGITGLPVKFDSPWRKDEAHHLAATDAQGIAAATLDSVTAADNGKTIRARLDVNALCPDKDTRGFFQALIRKLNIPETSMVLNVFEDGDTYRWHREFEGRKILIASAYRSGDSVGEWPKIHDELLNHIEGYGGSSMRLKAGSDLKQILSISKEPTGAWPVDAVPDTDIVMVAVADGKFNKRDNPKNPFGEDVQFAGEIRTITLKNGTLYFSDRYRGATGWNPMGEEMCMDVLALHVFKRWKMKYLKHISDE